MAKEIGQIEIIVVPTRTSIGTYNGQRARAARRTFLSNCKDPGRVCDMRPKGEAVGRGGYPPAAQTVSDITSCRLAVGSDETRL